MRIPARSVQRRRGTNCSWALVILTLLVGVAVQPVCPLGLQELPQQGNTLVIDGNETLLIPEGEAALLNGTITVEGNETIVPLLTIENRGEFRVGQNATIRCLNSSFILDNTGAITGRSLFLEALAGGNVTLLHRNLIDLDEFSIDSQNGGVASINATEQSTIRFGHLAMTTLNSTINTIMKGALEGRLLQFQAGGSPAIAGLFNGPLQAEEIVLEADQGTPQYLVNGHWRAINFTVYNHGTTTMNLQINGNITATNADIHTQGPENVFTNLAINGELSATYLSMRTSQGGLLTVQNTGTIRSNHWSMSCQEGRTDVFNWGDLVTGGTLSLVANGSTASTNLWQTGRVGGRNLRAGATGGGAVSILQDQGGIVDLESLTLEASGGMNTQRSTITVRNDDAGSWGVGSLFANITDANLDLGNQGTASIGNLNGYCQGQNGSGLFDNRGNLSIGNLNLQGKEGDLRFVNGGNLDIHNANLRSVRAVENNNSMRITNLFLTGETTITNGGSLDVYNMRMFAGNADQVGITNKGSMNITNSDVDGFSRKGENLILIRNDGVAHFKVIDLLSNVLVLEDHPPVGAEDYQILVDCSSGGRLNMENLNSGTAGRGGVLFLLGCETTIGNFFVWGNTDVRVAGEVEIESFVGPEGRVSQVDLSHGESLTISYVDVSTGPNGQMHVDEGKALLLLITLIIDAVILARPKTAATVMVSDPTKDQLLPSSNTNSGLAPVSRLWCSCGERSP